MRDGDHTYLDAAPGRSAAAGNPRIGLYSDSALVGGAERSLLHLLAAYDGDAQLVLCSPAPALLAAGTAAAPGTEVHLVPSAPSWLGTLRHHRATFRELGLDLVQVATRWTGSVISYQSS